MRKKNKEKGANFMQINSKTESSKIPGDIIARIYAAVEPGISGVTALGNPTNVNRDVKAVVAKLFPSSGVLEISDSAVDIKGGREYLLFIAGIFIGSRIRDEIDIMLG
jgi:3D (Asp-Asp-Asp) domain-containing protein